MTRALRGSHGREPLPTDSAGRPTTASDICGGDRLSARLPQTGLDPLSVPEGQGVAGSNPAVPTVFRTAWGPSGNQVGTIMVSRSAPTTTVAAESLASCLAEISPPNPSRSPPTLALGRVPTGPAPLTADAPSRSPRARSADESSCGRPAL